MDFLPSQAQSICLHILTIKGVCIAFKMKKPVFISNAFDFLGNTIEDDLNFMKQNTSYDNESYLVNRNRIFEKSPEELAQILQEFPNRDIIQNLVFELKGLFSCFLFYNANVCTILTSEIYKYPESWDCVSITSNNFNLSLGIMIIIIF